MVSVNSLFRDRLSCVTFDTKVNIRVYRVKSKKKAKLWECYEEDKMKSDFVCIIITVTLVTINAVKLLDTL